MKAVKIILTVFLVIVLLAMVVPMVIPVPALTDTVPAETLADVDSKFKSINGVQIHYKIQGSGEPVIVLLHGFGASTYSWRNVVEPLSKIGTVISYDRPAFGLTQRLMPGEWTGQDPYSSAFQPKLLIRLLDELGFKNAILVGNSAGGTVAVQTAYEFPDRVTGLVLVDAAIYNGGGIPSWLRPLLSLPQADRLGILLTRNIREWGNDFLLRAWHDPTKITPEIMENYRKPLRVANWDWALWQLTKAEPIAIPVKQRLDTLKLPVLVVTGDDDRIVDTKLSLQLAKDIQGSELAVFKDCGHVPQEECPEQFLPVVSQFIQKITGR
ncbi:MAG: alpha/beta hydrolase [Anaerolineaceae bacterium]|nr:alpha/beta hydrolase [Anaerolineaceae bacterium]